MNHPRFAHRSWLPLLALLVSSPALAAGTSVTGIGIGATLPQGVFAEFNDPSYFAQSRSIYAEKTFGGRLAAYYADTKGAEGAAGGRIYGLDIGGVARFGGKVTFGYVYAGAGYGKLTYTTPGATPGTMLRTGHWDWCWNGGLGVSINKKVYIEAGYVQYQTDPETTEFIPVVVGFEW